MKAKIKLVASIIRCLPKAAMATSVFAVTAVELSSPGLGQANDAAVMKAICPGMNQSECVYAVGAFMKKDWQNNPDIVSRVRTECIRATRLRQEGKDSSSHLNGVAAVELAQGDILGAGASYGIFLIVKENCPTAF
jgi:hypothetical protein